MSRIPIRRIAYAFDRSPISPAGLGSWVVGRNHDRRLAVAAHDPDWVAIQSRRGSSGRLLLSGDLTWADWERQREIEDRVAPTSRITRVLMGLQRLELGPVILAVETATARVRRGWAPRDVWSLDHHLCATTGAMLAHLADNTHGWPGGPEFPEFEDWQRALRAQAAALLAYDTDDEAAMANAAEALRWVADNLTALWD
jgi:hypothetical protein